MGFQIIRINILTGITINSHRFYLCILIFILFFFLSNFCKKLHILEKINLQWHMYTNSCNVKGNIKVNNEQMNYGWGQVKFRNVQNLQLCVLHYLVAFVEMSFMDTLILTCDNNLKVHVSITFIYWIHTIYNNRIVYFFSVYFFKVSFSILFN